MKKVNKYLGFSDMWFMVIGIPLTTIFATMIFCEQSPLEFFQNFNLYFWHGLIFTVAYWLSNRQIMIVLRKKFPELNDTLKRVSLNILISILIYPIVSGIVHGIIDLSIQFTGGKELVDKPDALKVITVFLVIFMIMTIYEAMYYFNRYKTAILTHERVKTEHINAQLTNLRNQVNPHFLFNSLNTLMSLIPRKDQEAHNYLKKLSSFYRYSVSEKDGFLIPLSKEIEQVKLYGDLIKERFGVAIELACKLDPKPSQFTLPMSLQMLVENAVKHNIVSKESPLRIVIYEQNNLVHVENTLQPRITETESTGMGLNNIRERFSYVTDQEILISKENGMFIVSIPIIHRDA